MSSHIQLNLSKRTLCDISDIRPFLLTRCWASGTVTEECSSLGQRYTAVFQGLVPQQGLALVECAPTARMFTHVTLLDRVARTVLLPVVWLIVRVV